MQLVGLDIGYSNLKLAWGQRGEVPRLRVLPAMAAPRAQVAEALGIAGPDSPSGTGSVAGSDAAQGIEVTLDGESWIAGVRPTRVCGWQRALHADYPASQSYQALLLAG